MKKKNAATEYRTPLFDRLFKPQVITLPNGHTVERPRSRQPLIWICVVAAVWASVVLTGFDFSILIKRGHQFTVILKQIFQPDWSFLPKVIAAYNAGPGSVQKWNNGGVRDNGDVLLFIESIPFRETRHYVEVVMRNYWLYQAKEAVQEPKRAASTSQSIASVAANKWPLFPITQPSPR